MSAPYEVAIHNLLKAVYSPRFHRPRPWRSKEESELIRRFAFWWFTCRDRNKPSCRDWARQLGISHTWLQKLVRKFEENPSEMWELQVAYGDPTIRDLKYARELTREMRGRGEIRPYRRRWIA